MPLCRLAIRSLLHSRNPLIHPNPAYHPRWRQAVQNYSTALEEGRKDEPPPPAELDLSKVSADSSYLDFILGPRDGELPSGASQAPGGADKKKDGKPKREAHRSTTPNRQTRQARLKRSKTGHQRATSKFVQKPLPKVEPHTTSTWRAWRARKPTARESQRIITRRSANTNLYFARARGMRMRTKTVAVRSGGVFLGGFSSTWNVQFARLQRYYDKVQGDYMKSRHAPVVHKDVGEWAKEALGGAEEDMPVFLSRLAQDKLHKRHYYWAQIALWLMHKDPSKMASFLRGTHAWPYPPVIYVDDSLRYLATHFSHEQDLDKLHSLAELFPLLADREKGGRLWVDGSFFRRLMPHCAHEQINEMYRAIKVHNVKVDWNTLLHFATHFATNGYFEQALDALLEAKGADAALDSFAFRSNCATLLRNSIRQPAGLRVCLRIVDNLVKIGVTLNAQLCNIVMLNAVEAGDLKTAFSIYSSLVEHGLQANSYTYAILLKGCKSAIGDAETLNTTIRAAIEHVNVVQEPVVALEILHCLALHHKKLNPDRAYETVADAFVQLFDSTALQQLGLLPSRVSQSAHPAQEKMQPSCQAMGIMLAMFLEREFERSQSVDQAYELYKRFRLLVSCGVEPFVSMTETDHVSNIFLTTFGKKQRGLLYSAAVIKDMQKPSSSGRQCKPTQHSWSIFLHGFAQHRQMKLAEQVLSYMRGRGIEPNKVTWNILATGYASAQDLEGTLDVLRRMELDNVTWDEWTLNGVRKLRDQDGLHEQLRRQREVPQLDFTRDIKDSLGERLNTFGEAPQRMAEKRPEKVESVADSPSDLAESDAPLDPELSDESQPRQTPKSRLSFPSRLPLPRASTSARHPQTPETTPPPSQTSLFARAMLAYTPPSSSPHHAFLSTVPSPLSPRSANIHGPPTRAMNEPEKQKTTTAGFVFDRSSLHTPNPTATTTTPRPVPKTVPFSQRSIKRAPSPRQDELKERRRGAFLRKVQTSRDDKRYEARGEDIMRLEFVRRRREYEDELKRSAPSPSAEEEAEEEQEGYDLPGWSSQMDVEVEVEDFARGEEEEMRALLENLPDVQEDVGMEVVGDMWSDDVDYDEVFGEVLRSEAQTMPVQGEGDGGEEMDMS